MTDSLKTGRAGAPVGTAGAVLVLLHGYGANGDDLLSLAPVLAPDLPGWAFLAPDAPDPCPGAPGGRQWAPIPWLDGSDAVAAAVAFHRSAGLLAGLIDTAQTEFGLGPGRVFLFGFSQGAMLALHVAPRLAAPLGGVRDGGAPAGAAAAWRLRRGGAARRPARGRGGAGRGRLRCPDPHQPGHGARHRARRAGCGIGLSAKDRRAGRCHLSVTRPG